MQSRNSQISFYVLCTLNVLFLFSNQLQAFLLTMGTSILFVLHISSIKKLQFKDLLLLLLMALPFLLIFLDLIRTPTEQWSILKRFYEIKYYCLFAPLVFMLMKKEEQHYSNNIFISLFISQFLLCIFILLSFDWNLFLSSANLNIFQYYFRVHQEHICGIHPTYFSLYLTLSFVLLLFYKWVFRGYIQYTMLAVFVLMLLLISSKIAVLVCLLLIAYFLVTQLRLRRTYVMYLIISIIGIMCIALFLNSRWTELISGSENEVNSVVIRKMIYSSNVALLKEHWLFGLGMVKLKLAMDVLFYQYSLLLSQPLGFYNTHNQFLEIWLQHGIIGLAAIILVIYVLIRSKIYKRNKPFFYFVIVGLLFMLTENILDRQQGILFFYYYSCLLLFVKIDFEPISTIEDMQ